MNYKAMWEELEEYIVKNIASLQKRRLDCNPRKEHILHQFQYRFEKVLEKMKELEEKHKYTL